MKVKQRRKLHRLQATVADAIWAILPSKLQEIIAVLDAYDAGTARVATSPRRPATIAPPEGSRIAVMNLFGTISQRQNWITSESGGTSSQVFARDFETAMKDSNIGAVLMVIDSPGGMVAGTQELVDRIYAARGTKPVWAFVDPMAASAAYWIASAADQIIAAPSAQDIGSIGVVRVHQDESKALEKAGITTTIIRSTENKYQGNSFEPLSEATKAHYQARVDEAHATFVAGVARNRNVSIATVSERFGKGSTFMAREALDRKMIDRVATLESVLDELSARVGTASSVSVLAGTPIGGGASMHAKVKMALVQMGLCSFANDQAAFDTALATLFAAHGQPVPQDHDECAKQIRALCGAAVPGTAAVPVATPPAPVAAPAAAGVSRPACDMISIGSLSSLIMTAGASLPADQKFDLQAKISSEMQAAGGSLPLSVVQDKINAAAVAANPPAGANVRIEMGEAEADKFHQEAVAAMVICGNPAISGEVFNRKTGMHEEFKRPKQVAASARQVALECMIRCGASPHSLLRLNNDQIARIVMGDSRLAFDVFGYSGASGIGNVTGMYTNLLYDAANVMLRKAYEEAAPTYTIWAIRGEDFSDYRTKHLVEVGVFPDPTAIGEDGEFDEVSTVDGRETMKIFEWGQRFTYSYVMLANDQLGGLIGRHQMKMGAAMARKENRLVYQELKDNPTLSDTGALFNSTGVSTTGGHNNLATGSISDYSSAIEGMVRRMAEQPAPGTGSGALGITAQFLLHPPAVDRSVKKVLTSSADPSASQSGVENVYRGAFQPVMDAELGAAFGGSDTAIYLAHDGSQTETVIYSYLAGQNAPIFNIYQKADQLGFGVTVHRAFGKKAVGWRGLQKHAGA